MSGHPVLRLDGITVTYLDEPVPALQDCSLAVHEGDRVALVGANGSGKTTLLMAVVGLLPFQGEIEVAGTRVETATLEQVRASVGFLFSSPEDQLLFPRVLDDVAFSLTRAGVPAARANAAAREALAVLDAGDLADRAPYRLSHGQRLRAALAGAIVARPPLLLLDEPSGGLDADGRDRLVHQLRALPSAMLMATHDLDFARRCCHRYVRLEAGRVVDVGPLPDDPAPDRAPTTGPAPSPDPTPC